MTEMDSRRLIRTDRCNLCGRPITDPTSVIHGLGPVCYSKLMGKNEEDAVTDLYDLPFDETERNITCLRRGQQLRFNFPQVVRKHSPTGMEWGYGGSGPADFAINAILRVTGQKKIAVSPQIYQEFKNQFVAKIPSQGGTIRGDDIISFVKQFGGVRI